MRLKLKGNRFTENKKNIVAAIDVNSLELVPHRGRRKMK